MVYIILYIISFQAHFLKRPLIWETAKIFTKSSLALLLDILPDFFYMRKGEK